MNLTKLDKLLSIDPNHSIDCRYTTPKATTQPLPIPQQIINGSFSVELTAVLDGFDNEGAPVSCTFAELRDHYRKLSMTNAVNDKANIGGYLQSSFYPLSERQGIWDAAPEIDRNKILADRSHFDPTKHNSKSEIFARTRSVLFLDFDDEVDISHVQKELQNYYYIAYTTHSHQVNNKGDHWRVCLFLDGIFTKQEWHQGVSEGLRKWAQSLGKVDKTCFTFSQFQKEPAINPIRGACDFLVNEGDDKKLVPALQYFDANYKKYEPVGAVIPPPEIDKSNKLAVLQQKLHDQERHLELTRYIEKTSAKYSGNADRVARMGVARKVIEFGGEFNDFTVLDAKIRKPDTNTSSKDRWDAAISSGAVRKQVAKSHVVAPVINPIVVNNAPTNDWDVDIIRAGYVEMADFAIGTKILFNGSLGIGKNKIWEDATDCVVLVPLLNIVGQMQSKNDPDNDHVLTYNKARQIKKRIDDNRLDPTTTTLVIDEFHNFLVSSYRTDCLYEVKKLFEYDWKKIICQTGTCAIKDFDHILAFDYKIRILREKMATRTAYVACDPSPTFAINRSVEIIKNTKQKSIILLNDKKKLEGIADDLAKHGIASFIANSDTVKDDRTEAYKMAQSSDYCMNEYQVLLGTATIVEGISIQDQINCANVIVIGNEPIQVLEQICGRFRNAQNVDLHIFARFEESLLTYSEHNQLFETTRLYNKALADQFNAKVQQVYGDNPDIEAELAAIRTAYNPDLCRFGLVYDKHENAIVDSGLGDGFKRQEWERAQFYTHYKNAQSELAARQFTIIDVEYNPYRELTKRLSKLYMSIEYDCTEMLTAINNRDSKYIQKFTKAFHHATNERPALDAMYAATEDDIKALYAIYDNSVIESWDKEALIRTLIDTRYDTPPEDQDDFINGCIDRALPYAISLRSTNESQRSQSAKELQYKKTACGLLREILKDFDQRNGDMELRNMLNAAVNTTQNIKIQKYINDFSKAISTVKISFIHDGVLDRCITTMESNNYTDQELSDELNYEFACTGIRSELKTKYKGQLLSRDEQIAVIKEAILIAHTHSGGGDMCIDKLEWILKMPIFKHKRTDTNHICFLGNRVIVNLTKPSILLEKILGGKSKQVRCGKSFEYRWQV